MPPWWQLAPGGCRYGALAVDGIIVPADSCSSPWPTASPAPKVLIQSYNVGQPRAVNQARLLVTAFVAPDQAATLDADHVFVGARIGIRNTATNTCLPGCAEPACLVLNSGPDRTPAGELGPRRSARDARGGWRGTA